MRGGVLAGSHRKGQTEGAPREAETPSPAQGLYVGGGFPSGPGLSSELEQVTARAFLLSTFFGPVHYFFFLLG